MTPEILAGFLFGMLTGGTVMRFILSEPVAGSFADRWRSRLGA